MTTNDQSSAAAVPTGWLMQWRWAAASIAKNLGTVGDRLDDLRSTLEWMETKAEVLAGEIHGSLQD